jgi:hypothetical protein
MLHLTELRGTLLSHAEPFWATPYPFVCAAPHWAKLHLAELHSTLYELAHPNWAMVLSYAVPYWAMLNPFWATLYPTELSSTMWATLQPNWATVSTVVLTTRTFVIFSHAAMPESIGIRVPQCSTGKPQYWTEMLDIDAFGIGLNVDAQLCLPIIKFWNLSSCRYWPNG